MLGIAVQTPAAPGRNQTSLCDNAHLLGSMWSGRLSSQKKICTDRQSQRAAQAVPSRDSTSKSSGEGERDGEVCVMLARVRPCAQTPYGVPFRPLLLSPRRRAPLYNTCVHFVRTIRRALGCSRARRWLLCIPQPVFASKSAVFASRSVGVHFRAHILPGVWTAPLTDVKASHRVVVEPERQTTRADTYLACCMSACRGRELGYSRPRALRTLVGLS
ncbi:hypothetical protein BCV70DRAFT_34073 [Testicularia cyperi]|uniref:Uncharacterized protein n=1 Tax=Testicularia cyperi TaxID=1882483 RepID=A0A317XJX0_9BASI|nr:hypothetical protein BCV70DRAFT_34073 [Testicularia cyperi]